MHVRQRGVNGEACFLEDSDRFVYLSHLRDLAKDGGCALHAYCLMTNHVHLLLTPSDDTGCTILMRELGQRYVPYFNRRHRRTGTLWEGRFRSCLVDSPAYVLTCYRYIECNPVEAHMVPSADAYPWSSYAGNTGERENKLLTPHAEYLALGETVQTRIGAYRALFQPPMKHELVIALRQATYGGYPLVGDALKAQLVAAGWRVEPGKPGPKWAGEPDADPISADLGFVETD
jgi:REP-associated tyrosine transposase